MSITSPKEAKESSAATLAELKKLIESYKINAISVDTTTFDDSGKDYDKGIFSQLRQFKVHPQQLIISEVVLKEIDRHYRERLTKSNTRFSLVGNVCSLLGATTESISIIESELSKLPPIDKICEVRLQEFLSESNATVLKPDDYIMNRPGFCRGSIV
ncbi:PIN domain-containing protein [Massilia sp. Mn16-1_5]|uniref:PIN domain-containing protein n=1 Tax=Massilia sp. Mn16-1_5 TaxID=2079199 RepID=UPI00109E4E02|nr:PIN domain-containing protein [Massilia sp. Mn16-1_5]